MIDKAKLAERIRHLDGLTNDERSQLLQLLNEQKRYGLVWEDKEEEVEQQLQDELPVLTEVVERRLPVVEDAPNHILIEGDNLHALTCLSYTHEGKIDVIYIDPPYNTGNKDFVYNDRYIDSEDDFRHSKWLSFMSKRLRIARRLLSDKGVIFISIDENEEAALKLLCNEIFGEKNIVGTFIWRKKNGGGQANEYFVIEHEYILSYRKSDAFIWHDDVIKRDKSEYKKSDDYGDFKITKLAKWGNTARREDRPSMYFSITAPDGTEVFPIAPDGGDGRWRVGISRMKELIATMMIHWEKRDSKWIPYEKEYYEGQSKTIKERSILYGVANTGDGSNELTELFCKKDIFENPKPSLLLKKIISPASEEKSTILDFFAGSGTTLHAVMQLNNEDGGHRQCILVTSNENGICENVTYERNRRVIQGYTNPKGEHVAGLSNNNLRYYRTDYVPRERTQRNMRALVNATTDMLCIQNDCYDELPFIIDGKKVRKDIVRRFGDMLIIYREEFAEDIAAEIAKMELGGKKLKIYIFSPGRYAFDDTFYDVKDKVELVALPAAIYDAYKRVLPKRKEKTFAEEEKQEIPTTLF